MKIFLFQTATQAHQQPSLPPGHAYFYGTAAGMTPGSFQYGTPAFYPVSKKFFEALKNFGFEKFDLKIFFLHQLPTATNAHSSTRSSQYPEPGIYASAYGSGYEGLSQTQDYAKSAYVSNNQSQSKSGVGVTSGSKASNTSELNESMYGKSHPTLGKVNVSCKQIFKKI